MKKRNLSVGSIRLKTGIYKLRGSSSIQDLKTTRIKNLNVPGTRKKRNRKHLQSLPDLHEEFQKLKGEKNTIKVLQVPKNGDEKRSKFFHKRVNSRRQVDNLESKRSTGTTYNIHSILDTNLMLKSAWIMKPEGKHQQIVKQVRSSVEGIGRSSSISTLTLTHNERLISDIRKLSELESNNLK